MVCESRNAKNFKRLTFANQENFGFLFWITSKKCVIEVFMKVAKIWEKKDKNFAR